MYLNSSPDGSPRAEETELKKDIGKSLLIPPGIIKRAKEEPEEPKEPEPKPVPSITKSLPNAFHKSRKLYPKEIEYVKKIYGDSINYDKVRITRDHWFSYGTARAVGNTIHFVSGYGDSYLFEDTPEQQLNKDGLELLSHEIGHVWQYQNGGIAYAINSLAKQAAGYYSTGSRDTAYDWQTAHDEELPWKKWGPEQQAEVIKQWNLAKLDDDELAEELQPYVEEARLGKGATQFSIFGAVVLCSIAGGIGYLVKKKKGAAYGAVIGLLINLPWNGWFLKKPSNT